MTNWIDLAPRDKFLQCDKTGLLHVYVEPVVGDLHITIYDFGPGGHLPRHSHTDALNHISICAMGTLLARWANDEEKILTAGSIIDLAPNVSHEFHELGGIGARLINIRRLGGTGANEVGEMQRIADLIAGKGPLRRLTDEEMRERGFK